MKTDFYQKLMYLLYKLYKHDYSLVEIVSGQLVKVRFLKSGTIIVKGIKNHLIINYNYNLNAYQFKDNSYWLL